MPISVLETKVSTLGTKQINVIIIGADAYRVTYRIKRAQVLTIFMRDLEYQIEKKARPETKIRTIIPAEDYDH